VAGISIFSAVLPVFGIIGIGWILRRVNWLTKESDQSLLRVNINLLFPCLVLDATLGNKALERWDNLLLAPAVGFCTVVAGILIAYVASPPLGIREPRDRRTFAVTSGLYNYSYIPLPLALLLFPGEETAGVLFVHNVGVEIAMWTLGVILLSGGAVGRDWKKFLNAPLFAILAALALNVLGAGTRLPTALVTGLHWLGQCAIPMSLILIGAVVSDQQKEVYSGAAWRVFSGAVALRMALMPVLFLMLAKALPVSPELKRVIVLQAAMPAAVFPIVMARHYGGSPATALQVVLATSLVGLFTIPLWIKYGLRWVGLD
jgi:predicted permease